MTLDEIRAVFDRHDRVAVQFSGGADSSAMLWLLRPLWDRVTVFHLDTGDMLPEAALWVAHVEQRVPKFVRVASPRERVIAEFGLPADIVPSVSTQFGIAVGGEGPLLQDRLSCCYESIMRPLHERTVASGATLIVRGQKRADRLKSPVRSGEIVDGLEILYPINDWSHEDVIGYLHENELPILPTYESGTALPDCVTCPAWLEDSRAELLVQWHPTLARKYRDNLALVMNAATPALRAAANELNALQEIKD